MDTMNYDNMNSGYKLDEENQTQNNGERNTFLSRIFGLQGEDAKRLMDTEEMSTFPLNTPELSNSNKAQDDLPLNINDSDFGRSFQNDGEDELRVPESDQDTSSEEDKIDRGDNGSLSSNLLKSQSESFHYDDRYPLVESSGSMESVPKIGQLSVNENIIDEEKDYGNTAAENDKFSQSTSPNKLKNKGSGIGLNSKPKNQRGSHLFSKYLNYDQPSKAVFTPLDNHNQTVNNKNTRNDSNNGTKSFIFQNDSTNQNNTTNKKRPNILRNIAVLNNTPLNKIHTLNPKEKALWKWANVDNLDTFLQDVYYYYLGNGFTCIMLQKVLNLITLIFIVYVSTYLGYCIDYSSLSTAHRWSEISQPMCYKNNITGFIKLFLWIFYIFIFLKVVQIFFDYKNLINIKNFYNYLLDISDDELQTIPWQNVIKQLIALKDQNALTANVVEVKAKNRISAHDVANRIMRKENYLIAMFNNNILDLSLPLPFFKSNVLTKTLEWNINLCVMGYIFNDAGFVKQNFLRTSQREYIKEELQKRFMLAGFLNIILSPFLVSYFILLYFFKYFNEYKTAPGSIGVRQYTPLAEWKFREYNELYHIFKKRIDSSIPLADEYTNQFPREKYNIIMKFISFISGSFVAILATLTIFDPDYFLNFEITNNKSVLFYLTIFGSVWTISHNSISKEYNVFEPVDKIKELSSYTHYLPKEWDGRYHTESVKDEFCKLYNLKLILLLRELGSLITTPFILWFSLPKSTDAIIDFFRDSSLYVDGLGYVCKYAMFDNIKSDDREQPNNLASQTSKRFDESVFVDSDNERAMNKMMQSLLYFAEDYENHDQALGKYQLPQDNGRTDTSNKTYDNHKYSWKKQFKPGQKPELFNTAKHSKFTVHNNNDGNIRKTSLGNGPSDSFIKMSSSSSHFNKYSEGDSRVEPVRREGVLKLVKEYYEQSNV
ncbi:autophagy-related protein 9 [Monosporozyma unispora]